MQTEIDEFISALQQSFRRSSLIFSMNSFPLNNFFLQDGELSNEELKNIKEKSENYEGPQNYFEPLLILFKEILRGPPQFIENQKQRTRLTALEIMCKGNMVISSKYNSTIEEITERFKIIVFHR